MKTVINLTFKSTSKNKNKKDKIISYIYMKFWPKIGTPLLLLQILYFNYVSIREWKCGALKYSTAIFDIKGQLRWYVDLRGRTFILASHCSFCDGWQTDTQSPESCLWRPLTSRTLYPAPSVAYDSLIKTSYHL